MANDIQRARALAYMQAWHINWWTEEEIEKFAEKFDNRY